MTRLATNTQVLNNPLSDDPSDHEGIAQAVQHYINGAKSGRGDDMKLGFHSQATIFGYVGDDLLAGPLGTARHTEATRHIQFTPHPTAQQRATEQIRPSPYG